MSIFKRRASSSNSESKKKQDKKAEKPDVQTANDHPTAEDITSSIRAELALEVEDIMDTDDLDLIAKHESGISDDLIMTDDIILTNEHIDDISDSPELETEEDIRKAWERDAVKANVQDELSIDEDTHTATASAIPDFETIQEAYLSSETYISDSEIDDIQLDSADLLLDEDIGDESLSIPTVTFSKEDETDDDVRFEDENEIYEGLPTPRHSRLNLAELRLDVVRITSDIENAEELYRRAQQRVESLMTFVDQAEVTGSLLTKMEPENRRLKARNRALQSELTARKQRLAALEDEVEEQRKIASKARIKVETLRTQLTDAHEAIRDRNVEIEEAKAANDELVMQAERVKTNLDIETRENITMRETLSDLSEQLEVLSNERLDALKDAETLKVDYEDEQRANEQLQVEIAELRIEIGKTRFQNDEMRDELMEIQEKVANFKAHQESMLMRRDDKIAKQEAEIANLKNAMNQKEEVVQNAVTDVSEMRRASAAHDVQREKLEKIIEAQSLKLQAAEEKILRSKKEAYALDKRYRDVAKELSKAQSRTRSETKDPDIYPTLKEKQIARRRELDAQRDEELERQQAESHERISKSLERDPNDIRSRFLDNPYVTLKRS